VLHARSVCRLSVCCIPKPLLFCITSAIWQFYLAFCRFCGDEPFLFGTSDVCCIATLVLLLF